MISPSKISASLTGHKLSATEDIQKEIVEFYKNLMGTSSQTLPVVNLITMKKGKILSYAQGLELSRDVTSEEIIEALKSIKDDKAPDIDGYNAHFYKKTWYTIKHDLIADVKEFFNIGKMYRPVNCTLITLVPKTVSPTTVKEFAQLLVVLYSTR